MDGISAAARVTKQIPTACPVEWEGLLEKVSLTNFTSPPSGRLAAVDGESHSSGRNNKNIKKVPLIVGAWNVRTLMDREEADRPMRRTALVAKELERYRIDIAALSETRFPGEGQLKEVGSGYTFF